MLQLVCVEENRFVVIFLGSVHLVRNVLRKHIGFDCILERRVDDGVIMDDGIGLDGFQLIRVEGLQMPGLQSLQREVLCTEIGRDGDFDELLIGTVGRKLDAYLGNLQPALQIIRKRHIGAQVLHLYRRRVGRPDLSQLCLRLALTLLINIAEHGVVVPFLYFKMP